MARHHIRPLRRSRQHPGGYEVSKLGDRLNDVIQTLNQLLQPEIIPMMASQEERTVVTVRMALAMRQMLRSEANRLSLETGLPISLNQLCLLKLAKSISPVEVRALLNKNRPPEVTPPAHTPGP